MAAKHDPSLTQAMLDACGGADGIAWMAAQIQLYKREWERNQDEVKSVRAIKLKISKVLRKAQKELDELPDYYVRQKKD